VYHQYTIRISQNRRDAVQQRLREQGIATMVYYPIPVHRLPVYRLPEGTCPHAEQAAAEVLSLPIWPQMSEAVQDRVITALRKAVR